MPFGYQNAKWLALVAQMQEGDELWLSSWGVTNGLSGAELLLLVRGEKVVGQITLAVGVC